MPKITEQSKKKSLHVVERPTKKEGKTLQEIQKLPQKLVEYKVVVFRVFECIVHLEIAVAQLKQVGTFPGPAERAEELKAKLLPLVAGSENLLKEYREIWGAMSKP